MARSSRRSLRRRTPLTSAPFHLPLRCSHVGDYVHHVEKAKEMRLDRQDGTGRA